MSDPLKEKKEFFALNGLRFAAAFWVLIFHCSFHFGRLPALSSVQPIIEQGTLAMTLFFMLSGLFPGQYMEFWWLVVVERGGFLLLSVSVAAQSLEGIGRPEARDIACSGGANDGCYYGRNARLAAQGAGCLEPVLRCADLPVSGVCPGGCRFRAFFGASSWHQKALRIWLDSWGFAARLHV